MNSAAGLALARFAVASLGPTACQADTEDVPGGGSGAAGRGVETITVIASSGMWSGRGMAFKPVIDAEDTVRNRITRVWA